MADDWLGGRIGQFSAPAREWRNRAQGSFETSSLGSGNVTATFDTGGGILKGILFTEDYNALQFSVRDNAATMADFASGAVTPGFVPCWLEFKNTLTVAKLGSGAMTLYLYVGTGLPPFV